MKDLCFKFLRFQIFKMFQTHVSKLPEEMMVSIFRLLPPQDLKSVMLVCKAWMIMGEDPTLWTWVGLLIGRREEFIKLQVRRFQFLDHLEIKEDCDCKISKLNSCLWKEDVWQKDEEAWITLCGMLVDKPRLHSMYGLWLENCCTNYPASGTGLGAADIFLQVRLPELGDKFTEEQSHHLMSAIAGNKCSSIFFNIWCGA